MTTYDQWKTTNPRDYEPEEDPASELEAAHAELQEAETDARRYREALLQLFCVVKALACPGGLSTETLRQYLVQHPACKAAADALHTDRLDDPKF